MRWILYDVLYVIHFMVITLSTPKLQIFGVKLQAVGEINEIVQKEWLLLPADRKIEQAVYIRGNCDSSEDQCLLISRPRRNNKNFRK